MKTPVRTILVVVGLLGAVTVGLWALQPAGGAEGRLGDAAMARILGRDPTPCDCNGLQLHEACAENGCPACKDAASCGDYVVVGTGVKHYTCTAGNPNTGRCEKNGERKSCTKKYNCQKQVEPEPGQKCNAAVTLCIAGEPEDNCILCSKTGNGILETFVQSYKCE